MTVRDLLERLENLGVRLSIGGDRVRARAPDGVLTQELRDAIANHKTELLELLSQEADDDVAIGIPRAAADAVARLTPGQDRIWRLVRRDSNTAAYNLCEAFRLTGLLDNAALDAALAALVARHENLRSEIVDGSEPTLHVLPTETVGWRRTDLSGEEVPLEAALTVIRRAGRAPFDLQNGPLVRFQLLQLGEDDHVIAITMHHIITDGSSFEVIYDELAKFYSAARTGLPSTVPEPHLRWVDVAAWQRKWINSPAAELAREYWREVLSPPPEPLALPHSSTKRRGYDGGQTRTRFAVEVGDGVERLCAASNASAFMVLLTGLAYVLHSRTRQPEIVICAPAACREHPELETVVGYLNNLLVLRIPTAGNPTFRELLATVREVSLGAFRHQQLPFQEIAELPHLARVPLTRAMFAYQGESARVPQLDGLETTRLEGGSGTANFDLALYVARGEDGLDAELSFKLDAFESHAAELLLDDLSTVIIAAAKDPDLRLSTLVDELAPSETVRAPSTSGQTAEFDPLEVQLTRIWERVLGTWPVHLDDDFFTIGGHSLLAVRLLDEIEDELGRALPLATFFEVTTVRSLARALQTDGWVPPTGPLVTMQAAGSARPLFLVHSFEGHVFFYNELARSMGPEHPVYGFQAPGLDGVSRRSKRVEPIAELHLRALRGVQPEGPYTIAAMCFGVAVALELARRLHAEGEEVQVVFLDSVLDGHAALNLAERMGSTEHSVSALVRRRWRVFRQHRARIRDRFKPGGYDRRERQMRWALARAWERYRPGRFSGTITLIRSDFKAADRTRDWQSESLQTLTGANVETRVVSGDHFELLREPNVGVVADAIKSLME